LSRITPPTSGRITIHGRVASLLEVGTGFHPDLTGRENIFLNGAVLGMSRIEIRQKFDEIVAFAEVDRFLDTPVKRYSSGMYVRLAFAVAAHLTPEILIVDEVLAVGDTEFQKKCLGVMQNVSTSQGRTVFFVSHNMAAVQGLCTRAILLSRGEVAHIGPAQEVVDLYISKGDSSTVTNTKIIGKHFEFLALKVSAPDGSPLSTFKPCQVTVHFRPLTPIVDAGVHILFEDLNGSAILGLESRDFIEKVRALAGQELMASFRIQSLPLNPGPFRLRVWIRSHSDHLHWEVPATFEVHVEETLIYGVRQIDRKLHGAVSAAAEVDVRQTV
jgi:lipopolysaccharide transport system ATP-binding protein